MSNWNCRVQDLDQQNVGITDKSDGSFSIFMESLKG